MNLFNIFFFFFFFQKKILPKFLGEKASFCFCNVGEEDDGEINLFIKLNPLSLLFNKSIELPLEKAIYIFIFYILYFIFYILYLYLSLVI